ncbi:MAG: RNA polymerase sigma factor [Chloroflexota bacterium]
MAEPVPGESSVQSQDVLVRRARAGDHDAFAALAVRVTPRLYGLAVRILRDVPSAEDVVQQSLVDAWRDLRGLRDAAAFNSWIVRLLVRNAHREARRTRAVSRISFPAPDPGPNPMAAIDERDAMEHAFRELTPEHRVVLTLRHYLGWDPAEIARALGVADGTVRSRLHYALASLRAALEASERGSRS